jgi:hypothetical protein
LGGEESGESPEAKDDDEECIVRQGRGAAAKEEADSENAANGTAAAKACEAEADAQTEEAAS